MKTIFKTKIKMKHHLKKKIEMKRYLIISIKQKFLKYFQVIGGKSFYDISSPGKKTFG